MKYKTLFRLMLKAIGVWLFFDGVSWFLMYAPSMIAMLADRLPMGASVSWEYVLMPMGPLIKVGAGVYLFFGGARIVDKAVPGNRPYCPECAYDLSGAVSNRCPECGTPFRPEDVRPQVHDPV